MKPKTLEELKRARAILIARITTDHLTENELITLNGMLIALVWASGETLYLRESGDLESPDQIEAARKRPQGTEI
jgi:hypothetical protein